MEQLFCVSISVIAGLLLSRIAKKLKLPAVTAYLVAGILIGPYVLGQLNIPGMGFISTANVKSYSLLCDVALGFIAFDIGNEFRLSQLKKIGSQAVVITCFEALSAVVLVDIVMVSLHFLMPDVLSLPAAIVLGAIAAATAPAATLMVVKQYKAKGPLTSILLPVVALDDAVGLMAFAVSYGVARALMSGAVSVVSMVIEPLIEIAFSLLLGAVMGAVLDKMETLFDSNSKRLSIVISMVLFTVAASMIKIEIAGIHVGFSSLLVCMMMGTVFCNICNFSEDMMGRANKWTAPLYVLFFVLSGAELELSVFANIAVIGIGAAYIATRSAGKLLGAAIGSTVAKCDTNIRKYLGITLLPQAGVALGMSLKATQDMGADGQLVRNIILFGVMVYELVGPMMTKNALMSAGEIQAKPEIIKTPNRPEYSRH